MRERDGLGRLGESSRIHGRESRLALRLNQVILKPREAGLGARLQWNELPRQTSGLAVPLRTPDHTKAEHAFGHPGINESAVRLLDVLDHAARKSLDIQVVAQIISGVYDMRAEAGIVNGRGYGDLGNRIIAREIIRGLGERVNNGRIDVDEWNIAGIFFINI